MIKFKEGSVMFNGSSDTRVFVACQNGDFPAFIQIFKKEDANRKYQGMTLLHHALHFERVDIVDALLRAGSNPAICEDQEGQSALFAYIYDKEAQRDMKVVAKLVKANKAAVNVVSGDGFTPLHVAVTLKDIELATYLLEQDANPNATTPGKSPLAIITAIQQKDSKMLALLLKYKADYTIPSSAGTTPLGYILSLMTNLTLTLGRDNFRENPEIIKLKEMGWLLVEQHRKDGRPLENEAWANIMKPNAPVVSTHSTLKSQSAQPASVVSSAVNTTSQPAGVGIKAPQNNALATPGVGFHAAPASQARQAPKEDPCCCVVM